MGQIMYPDYKNSILAVISSMLKYYGADNGYDSLPRLDVALQKKYKNVVLMVFDAMGCAVLDKNLSGNSFLQKSRVGEITSVFPPTTAAAMTVFYSSVPPIVNGWLSSMCYFKEHDRVVLLYRNQDFYTKEILNTKPVADEVKFVSVYEQIEKATLGQVQATELSPFNQSKVSSVEDICTKIKELCAKEKQQFVLAYWPEPDATMHKTGTSSAETKSVLDNINKMADKLSSELKDTLLIITADHGHVDLDEEIYINEYPELEKMLLHPLSFEDRVVSVFVKPEYKNEFPQLLNKLFPNEFIVLDREKVLKEHLFGKGKAHERALDFIGDFVIASVGNKSLRQHIVGTPKMPALRGSHAGLCADEMRVPLIIIEKNK